MARYGPRPRDIAARFWEKVDKTGECWVWTAAVMTSGYGTFRINEPRRQIPAHRLAWELTYEVP